MCIRDRILVIAHDRQVIAENAGKIGENPAFDVSVLQHIEMCIRDRAGVEYIGKVFATEFGECCAIDLCAFGQRFVCCLLYTSRCV